MEKLKMKSQDLSQENIAEIRQLFPDAVTEVKENGNIKLKVDFDVLRQELSDSLINDKQERYQMTWPGKKEAILLSNSHTTMTLRPIIEKSTDFDNTKNLYIEGDNLEVLKALRETYLGKIKMIYIDPPYNTGNDFVYKDDFFVDIDSYSKSSGQSDDLGNRLVLNSESNGRYHSDWLNMIYPRLKLAKDFLSTDGVIFISIDDHEASNLRKVCDEVFGENNFIADLIWQKKFSRSNDATYFSTMHDHILCYCKVSLLNSNDGWHIGLLDRKEVVPAGYTNPDNDPRGPWTSVILSAKSGGPTLLYEIQTPSGKKVLPPSGRYWSCSKGTFEKWKADNRIWFGSDGNGSPRKKTFLSEVQSGLRPNTIFFQDEAGNNQEAKQEIKDLFGGIGVFDGPKPVRLIKLLLKIGNVQSSDIVMDFFSGCATTAHAVMSANSEDGGSRQYILVQIPEGCPCDSEAYKNGFNTICDIGEERIRKAGKKIQVENPLTTQHLDVGFRVFKLDSSNMKDVYYNPADIRTNLLDNLESNIKDDRSSLDILIQCMLSLGIPLDSTIKMKVIMGKTCYVINDNDMVCCFDEKISEKIIKQLADIHPLYACFKDSSFENDSTSVNCEQIFKTISPTTKIKVI